MDDVSSDTHKILCLGIGDKSITLNLEPNFSQQYTLSSILGTSHVPNPRYETCKMEKKNFKTHQPRGLSQVGVLWNLLLHQVVDRLCLRVSSSSDKLFCIPTCGNVYWLVKFCHPRLAHNLLVLCPTITLSGTASYIVPLYHTFPCFTHTHTHTYTHSCTHTHTHIISVCYCPRVFNKTLLDFSIVLDLRVTLQR